MKITVKTNEDVSYRGEPIRKMERALDRAMKKAGFSFVRTTKMGDHQFKKDGKTYSYHIHGQSGDPQYFDYVTVTKGEVGWDKDIEQKSFDDIDGAVAWLSTKTSEKRIAKKYGAKNEGPGAGYFIKLKNVNVDKVWVNSARQYSILKAKFSADWEANHSYWGGEGSADDFEVAIYLDRSLDEFMEWPGAEEEYAQKGSLFDFVKDTCLDDIKNMLNFDCGREGYTYGGGWTTKIPSDGVFEFDNMQFDPDACTVYQYHDKSYVPVSITSEDMMYGIQDAWDEWNNPENPEDESKQSEASEQMAINAYANKRFYDPEEFVKYVRKVAGKNGSYLSADSVVSVGILDKANRLVQKDGFKKFEGLPFGKRFTDAAGHKIELSDWRIKEDDLGYFCGYDKGGKPIFDQDISKSVVFPVDPENYPNDDVSKEMDRLRKMGYTNTRKLQKATHVESKKSEGIASDIRAAKPTVYLVSEAGNDYDYDELLDAFEGEQSYVSVETAGKPIELPLAFDRDKNLLLIFDDELSGDGAAYAKELVQGFVDGKTSVSSKPLTNDYVCIVDGMDYTATCYVPESKKNEKESLGEARKSNKAKALAELSDYFGRTPDGNTIHTSTLSREDEIEIGNICDKYGVDFALGTSHVTIFGKGESKKNEKAPYAVWKVKFDSKADAEKEADELHSIYKSIQPYVSGDSIFVKDSARTGEIVRRRYASLAKLLSMDDIDYKRIFKGGKTESKKSEGLPPKKLGNRLYRSRADLINKMKTLDAVEITTPAQFNDIHSKQWLHTAGYAMDINGNLVGQTYFGDKDGKWYYATTKTFQGDYLPECKEEAKKSESDTADAEQVFKDMADSLGISDRSVITTDGDRVKFVLKLKLKNLEDYAWEYNPKLKVVKNIASPTADAFDGARKTVNTVEDAAAWLKGGIEELLNMEKEAIDLVGNESKKNEDTQVGKFTIMPKDTSRKQAGIRAYQTRLGEMGFKSNLHNNGDYIHDYVKEIGKIPGAIVYVGTIDNFQQKTQEYQYEAELYMENESGIRSNIEYMPFAITDISDGTQRKMYFNRLNALIKKGTDFVNNHESSESCKKSESLTLKQAELKKMAKYGEAEDITSLSDAEAKELKKSGVELVGISRGIYGMNGALMRGTTDGKLYVITSRNSNLFYFV